MVLAISVGVVAGLVSDVGRRECHGLIFQCFRSDLVFWYFLICRGTPILHIILIEECLGHTFSHCSSNMAGFYPSCGTKCAFIQGCAIKSGVLVENAAPASTLQRT